MTPITNFDETRQALYKLEVVMESTIDLMDVLDRFTKLEVTKTRVGDVLVVTDVSLKKVDINEDIIIMAIKNWEESSEILAKIDEKRIKDESPTMTNEEKISYRRVRLERILGTL